MKRLVQKLQKGAVLVGGVSLLILGAALLVLPGPGLLTLLAGLALLSTEFEWAESLRKKMHARVHDLADETKARARTFLRRTEPEPISQRPSEL